MPELRKLVLQIGSSPFDVSFELGNAAVEILGRPRPLASVQRGFRSDVGFEPLKDREEFVGREFLLEQLPEAIQESRAQGRIAQETILQPVPARDPGRLARAQQNGKIGLVEGLVPMIAKRTVEIPGKDKPLSRTAPVIDQEMVFVEPIPVLDQDGGRQVVDVFFQVQAAGEKVERVRGRGQFVAEELEVTEAVGLLVSFS